LPAEIEYKESVLKDLRKIGMPNSRRIVTKLEKVLGSDPNAGVQLKGEVDEPVCFGGTVLGKIAPSERRKSAEAGFGFDPLFIPSGGRKTFAEMSIEEKNRSSHRANAFRKFAKWYKTSAQ
jgi:non-canonical purine NTP pyrophosphatase (RdgB/HAM1 family)